MGRGFHGQTRMDRRQGQEAAGLGMEEEQHSTLRITQGFWRVAVPEGCSSGRQAYGIKFSVQLLHRKKKKPTQHPLTAKLCMCNYKKSLRSFGVLQISTNIAVLSLATYLSNLMWIYQVFCSRLYLLVILLLLYGIFFFISRGGGQCLLYLAAHSEHSQYSGS